MNISTIRKAIYPCWIFLTLGLGALAQPTIVPTYGCVIAGNSAPYPYTVSGLTWSTADHWCITGGTISGTNGLSCQANQGSPEIGVIWNAGITTGTVAYYVGNASNPTVSLTVTPVSNVLSPSVGPYAYPVVPSGQELNVGFTGTNIAASTICTVIYQWATSTNGTTFTAIPNSNSQNFQISGVFTSNVWFERMANLPNGVSTSNVMEIQPVAGLTVGTVTPATYTVYAGASVPANEFSSTATTGGTECGPGPYYSCSWQTSTDNVNWTTISQNTGSGAFSFSPGSVTQRTYIRQLVQCGQVVGISNTVVVQVFQPLNAGVITPFSTTIPSGTSPGALTGAPATNGNTTNGYTYTWYSSTNVNGPFSDVGSGLSYTPGILTAANNYFYRTVSDGTSTVSSNTIDVMTGTAPSYGTSLQIRELLASAVTTDAAAAALTALTDVHQTTVYYDGLGRPVEKVAEQGSLATGGNPTDLVTPIEYDAMGREIIKYLPYAAASEADGHYEPQPFQQQNAFNTGVFAGQNYYYSQEIYEASSLNRIDYTTAPGISWTGSNRSVQTGYESNTALDEVRIWQVANSSTTGVFGQYSSTTVYPAGALYKKITTDEEGHQQIVFTDLDGQVILKKVQYTAAADDGTGSGHAGWLCTYYIYDDLNELRCVIQPQGVVLAEQNEWELGALNGVLLTDQCFRYEYDQRKRVIMKQVPGAAVTYMVYDNLDRVVMTQNGNQRNSGTWEVNLYEPNLDRLAKTGIYTNGTSFSSALSAAYTSTSYPFAAAGAPGYPTFEMLTETNYDTYTGLPSPLTAQLSTSAINMSNFYTGAACNVSPNYALPLAQQSATTTMGAATWTEREVLGTGASKYITSVNIYDDYGRVIQTQTVNYLLGVDISTTQFNFSGKPLISDMRHQIQPASLPAQTYEIATINSYDGLERVTQVQKEIVSSMANPAVSQAKKTVSTMAYDALGRPVTKGIGNNAQGTGPLETQAMEYNIRGWLLGLNRASINNAASTNFFGYELGFDNPNTIVAGTTYNTSQYGGNVAGTVWKTSGDEAIRKYDFGYDQVDRLQAANFGQYTGSVFNTSAGLDFSVISVGYDANGNITGLSQRGWNGSSSPIIDQLTYTPMQYTNKLLNVIDPISNSSTLLNNFHYSQAYTTMLGSAGKTNTTQDYWYDANGNLTIDRNKDIVNTQYDYLNQPTAFSYSTGKGQLNFVYDAAGNKLAKIVTDNLGNVGGTPTTITTTTTYIAGFTYQSVQYSASSLASSDYQYQLQYFGQEEGRVRALYTNTAAPGTISGFAFDYFLKDQVGDARVVITEEAESDNYPTLTFEGTTPAAVANQNAVWDNSSGQSINVQSTQVTPLPTGFTTAANGTYCGSITKSQGAIGAAKLLRVMAGDLLNVSLQVTYSSATVNNMTANGLNTLATSLATMILGSGQATSLLDGQASSIGSGMSTNSGAISFFSPESASSVTTGVPPEAYLHILFFNDQFVFDNVNSVVKPVSTAALNAMQLLSKTNLSVPRDGYVYIYFSNESNTAVYFDNFTLTDTRGPILETNSYYPFGLMMDGISDMALKSSYIQNRFRFNGKELQNQEFSDGSGMEEYDYGARMEDPQLGIWRNIDPKSEKYYPVSPYLYTADNPVKYTDPNGEDFTITISRNAKGEITGVTIGATIYIKGDGASDSRANEMNKYAKSVLKSSTSDGVTVGFNVNYVYDNDKKASDLGAGENLLTFTKIAEGGSDLQRSNIYSFGNAVFDDDGNIVVYTGNQGTVFSSGSDNGTVLHESMHLLGLSDRYDDRRDANGNIYSQPHTGFEHDIMYDEESTTINPYHYQLYAKYGKMLANIYFFGDVTVPVNTKVDRNKKEELLTPYEAGGVHHTQ